MPSTDEEVWRYSRVADIDLADWAPVTDVPAAGIPDAVAEVLAALPERAATVVVRNGFVVHAEIDPGLRGQGPLRRPPGRRPVGRRRPRCRSPARAPTSSPPSTTPATPTPCWCRCPPASPSTGPSWSSTGSTPTASAVFPRLVVRAGDDAERQRARLARLRRRRRPREPGHRARRRPRRPPRLHQRAAPRPPHLAGRLAAQPGRRRRHPHLGPGAASAATTPALRTDCRLVGRGATGDLLAALLRRRRPDARLPHLPGARRPRHHQRTCCSRARSSDRAARSTPASSRSRRTPAAPTPSRPTATSSSPTTPGPSRCPTSRSRTTTCTAATPRRSARSTRSSASTSRAAACPPRSPSG